MGNISSNSSSLSSLLQLLHLQPLWGGGFTVALCQLSLFYYVLGALLHWVLPLLYPVRGIQEAPRKPGEVGRDALNSIGQQDTAAAAAAAAAAGADMFLPLLDRYKPLLPVSFGLRN
jgi:hypothetical protein